jgi:hypothetical protein
MFSKTTKALAGQVGKTYQYGNDARLAIQNLSPMILEVSKDLPDTATKKLSSGYGRKRLTNL